MDPRVRDEVGLKFCNINVQSTIEPQRCSEGRDHLRYEAIEVGVGGALNVKGAPADVIDGFIVEEDCNVCVFEERVGGEDTVVGFDNRG